jgi:hypothetical protein
VIVSTEAVDTAKGSARAVGNCRVCELEIALWFLVGMICKCSINPIAYPNSVYSHYLLVTIFHSAE